MPADKHRVEDGLSRRPPADEDSSESDGEGELNKLIGLASRNDPRPFDAHLGAMVDQQTSDKGAKIGIDHHALRDSSSCMVVSTIATMGEFASSKADRIAEWQRLYPASHSTGARLRTHNADVVQVERLEPSSLLFPLMLAKYLFLWIYSLRVLFVEMTRLQIANMEHRVHFHHARGSILYDVLSTFEMIGNRPI